jgi:RHS repeat protein
MVVTAGDSHYWFSIPKKKEQVQTFNVINMKYPLYIALLMLFISCKKEPGSINWNGKLLTRVSANGKTYETFQYNADKQLLKYKYFGFCDVNPTDEDNFFYENKKLKKVESVIRSMYSSSTAICDPATGISSDASFEYNSQGQLIKIFHGTSFSDLIYNGKGLIEKVALNGGGPQTFYLFEYDARGNVIKQTDPQGGVITYEYDNKLNPFYLIRHKPHVITAFNLSPNNVVKGTSGGNSFTRHIEYNQDGLPASVTESTNNTVYQFQYQ